jgi:hypothetical protein
MNGRNKVEDAFVTFDSNYENVMHIHVPQKGEVYRNFNDNKKDKVFDIDESFSNFNLTPEYNKLKISRLLQKKK